jgi:hypothetical protein
LSVKVVELYPRAKPTRLSDLEQTVELDLGAVVLEQFVEHNPEAKSTGFSEQTKTT